MKKIFCYIFLFILPLFLWQVSQAQEERKIELTAQGILARVDSFFQYPTGLITGRMKHIMPDGHSYSIRFKGYISREDFLFIFSSRERGKELKVLYNLGGEDIWVYAIHALKLYHKLGIDKYDPVLKTNFSYMDLSNADFQSNYTATIIGKALIKGMEAYKLKLVPIFKGGEYGELTLYVTQDGFVPIRIDFHDRDKAIFKFLSIAKVKKKGNRTVPLRYDMMNIRTGTVTILKFTGNEPKATIDRGLFRSEKLGG